MKAKMNYRANTYGNSTNAHKYQIRLTRVDGSGSVEFRIVLATPAAGRGVGWGQGALEEFSLLIPEETALALSNLLPVLLSGARSNEVSCHVDETDFRRKDSPNSHAA